jgi:hypothetical protein
MATLYLTEFTNSGAAHGRSPSMGQWPAVAKQTLAIGGAVSSAAFNKNTNMIRVHCDAICSITIGAAPQTALTTDARLAANQTEYHSVNPGHVLSVVSNT